MLLFRALHHRQHRFRIDLIKIVSVTCGRIMRFPEAIYPARIATVRVAVGISIPFRGIREKPRRRQITLGP